MRFQEIHHSNQTREGDPQTFKPDTGISHSDRLCSLRDRLARSRGGRLALDHFDGACGFRTIRKGAAAPPRHVQCHSNGGLACRTAPTLETYGDLNPDVGRFSMYFCQHPAFSEDRGFLRSRNSVIATSLTHSWVATG